MADIKAADVKRLRDATGVGMMDCKQALVDTDGDFDKARTLLRERGLADAAKRKGRAASEGLIHSYLHAPTPGVPPRVGVLVEVSTETDFTAKNDELKNLAQDIAMHIAAAKPQYLTLDDVPESVLTEERELAAKKLEGKPDHIVEKAVEGSVRKWAQQFCLLEQKYVKDDSQTVSEIIAGIASKTGENIGVRRFVRFEVAEGME